MVDLLDQALQRTAESAAAKTDPARSVPRGALSRLRTGLLARPEGELRAAASEGGDHPAPQPRHRPDRRDASTSRSTPSCIIPPSRSWRRPGVGCSPWSRQLPDDDSVKIRVLNISWKELVQDLSRALEFDQSQLFRKVYDAEFGHPGGEPFGVLLGDYEIRHRPGAEHPYRRHRRSLQASRPWRPPRSRRSSPASIRRSSAWIASRSWNGPSTCPGLRAARIPQVAGVAAVGRRPVRRADAAPRADAVALRRRGRRGCRACYSARRSDGPDRSKYLWGNAVYAFGGRADPLLCPDAAGWPTSAERATAWTCAAAGSAWMTGGWSPACPSTRSAPTRTGVATKCSTDVIITDAQEKELGDLGFIPLCHCQDTRVLGVLRQPVDPEAGEVRRAQGHRQRPAVGDAPVHALRLPVRPLPEGDRPRQARLVSPRPSDCESALAPVAAGLHHRPTTSRRAGVKARYPAARGQVQVREQPDKPGTYSCVIHLRPHFQLDQMSYA